MRVDPGFLDMRCALTAFLWGCGREGDAEREWQGLQSAAEGVGEMLYNRSNAVERVKSRWPPRATAALHAFIEVSRSGVAEDYDGITKVYDFSKQIGDC